MCIQVCASDANYNLKLKLNLNLKLKHNYSSMLLHLFVENFVENSPRFTAAVRWP